MGDQHQFRLPFSTQQNPFANNTQKSAVSQEPSAFQNSQSIFSSADPKPVFGSTTPNANSTETKNSIFGGSAFAKPNEDSFTTQGRQNIFGGTAHLNAPSQQALLVLPNSEANTNVSQSILFSRPQTIFGGLSAKTDAAVSTGANSIFGGTVKSQNSGEKGNPFSDVTSINAEATSTTKLSIFGGSYIKKEEPSLRLGFSTFSKTQEMDSGNLEKSKNPPTSLPEKQLLFPSSKSSFAGFPSSSGVVTSSRPHQAQENTDAFEFEKKEPLLSQSVKLSRDQPSWEPDSVDHENKDDSAPDQSKGRSTKIIRKRGVFGKAIEDVAKLSSRSTATDETRSIMCHPLSGDFPDISVLKDYFSRFNSVRVTINKDRRYAIATFKNHADAAKAMDAGDVIDGVKYRIFWRNLAKARRKSSEEGEKSRSSEEKRKVSRRAETEFDSSVMEELEAISGLEYFTPGDRTKRKSELESEIRKRSRTVSKPSSEIERVKPNETDKGIRNSSQGIEGSKPRFAGTLKDMRTEEKSSLRTKKIAIERMSFKKSNETDEGKSEKNERGTSDSTVTPSAASSELLVILKQQAVSSDDKLRVLEARDKLMRLRKVRQYDISKAVKTVGTCPDMCPEKERLLRESRRQISQYEMNVSKNEMDPNLMVKQYSRSSADQEEPLPHELRPPAVLTMTMNYLMHGIMNLGDQPGENLGEWYHFLWDRLRGIRKEITQQELCDIDAVRLVEQCARFHIHCGARLVAEDMSVFDDRINTENLTKCLQTLKHMYHDLWMNSSVTCPYESEFISYFLLLNLNNGTIMWEMEQLREEVLESPEIGFVAAMYNSLSSNNFVRFFRLVRKASYLNSCLCIRYFYQVRAKALATLVKALAKIRPVQYPLLALVEDLGFENADHAATFCTHYGLAVSSESACVILSQETFCNPTFVLPSERAFRLVESKKIGSVGEVVNGGPLPFRMYESHTVHNSFDGNNYLHKNAFYAKDQGAADMDIKDVDGDVCPEETDQTENLAMQQVVQRSKEEIQTEKTPVSFGGPANQKLLFSSAFSSTQPVCPSPFGSTDSQVFKGAFNLPVNVQAPPERQETLRSNTLQVPTSLEPARGLASRNVFVDQNQAEIEAQKKARAELDATINHGAEIQFEDLLQSSIREVTAEVTLEEMKTAQEEHCAEERRRAEAHMHAIEELRKRALEAHIDKISNDSLLGLVSEVVSELIFDSAHEANVTEETLITDIDTVSEETLSSLMCLVVEELCCDIASEELRCAKELARKEAVQQRVKQIFYHWLERARHSLHRKCVMEDFPASVIPLSLKEHAERWGFSTNLQDVCVKRDKKILDLRDLKATPTYPQITFAELVGIQAVHRYDSIRSKMGLRPTDKLLYKLFISIPEEEKDVAAQLIEWWIRRTFKQNSGILHDNVQKGIYRVVSGAKVTAEVAVYASLQVVRGNDPLTKHTGLASGTCAVLFSVSPTSNILESRSRLTTLLKSVSKLPAMPLVVAVVCPSEPPLDGLKQLVVELELDQWLGQGIISDYQILHVENLFDLKYLAERFNMALNYMVMTWTPCPEFSLVCLKNVLRSTFQMFYISIQYNHNSSGVYPQDIDDPRIIIGLCNEWLDHMCHEFVTSYYEARDLCGEEFWPLLHKGAYLPFLNKPRYVELLQEVIKSICLPPMQWPPSSEEEFETMFTQYCSWLRPEEYKQTQRRLSCLNGLLWSEKIKSLPWINLIEDWMEARINYIETSIICGSELLCLMKPQNVEQLYTYPWWAQSKYVTLYLESLGLGRECEMDVDQTVPFENVDDEQGEECTIEAGQRQPNLNSGLSQLEEVACCVNELKGVNESLLTRLRSALADGAGDVSSTINSSVIVSKTFCHVNTMYYLLSNLLYIEHLCLLQERENINVVEVPSSTQGFKTLVNAIDLQVQAQRDLRTRVSHILSSALAEGMHCNSYKNCFLPLKD
ncbi:hypothetical protein ONE63_004140 [Megalurothrips usitatus]|uniref:SAC3/GANP/THP3 conserved domain-containing protein n=1 Tax=Megalurothrips usitatus TaxID=439358 RepID=A0AAV7X5Y2_9NEOP|nr:hypothetical protein ONE63_004140 [Megalurothrips usitatus]